jgi:carboxyl-terminal processing protease
MPEENKNINHIDGLDTTGEEISQNESELEDASETMQEIGEEETAEAIDPAASQETNEQNVKKDKKKKKTISVPAFLLSSVALVLATLMLTYSICAEVFRSKYSDGLIKNEGLITGEITDTDFIKILEQYVDSYYYGEADKEKMLSEALKAYMAATGDLYATYYTLGEILENNEESAGRMKGVGVNIVNDTCVYRGVEVKVLNVFNVMDNSPALEAGILPGDMILCVGIGADRVLVDELGYDEALDKLIGEIGAKAEFVVLRKNGNSYEEIDFSITRDNVETMSVKTAILDSDPTVGILKISTFDYTTPKQFENKVEELKKSGCTKFIIDMRYNPGGFKTSVQGLLSFFLNENDVYMQTKDKSGNVSKLKITPVSYQSADMQGCNVDKEDIGKYRDLDFAVLCNEGTASAAELFVANIKDYGLAKVVGAKTFGKGSMQTTYTIKGGLLGAVKLTTHHYFSGGDTELIGYNGVGITPNVEVALSEEAKEYNFYVLPQNLDDQLIAAVNELKQN